MKRMNRLAAGGTHSMVVTERCELYVWGSNYFGQVGNHSLEDVLRPMVIFKRNAKECFGARWSSLMLDLDDRLWAWGYNEDGILGLGHGVEKQQIPVQVDTGGHHIRHAAGGWKHFLAVTLDGKVLAWGSNDCGQLGDGSTQKRRQAMLTPLPNGKVAKAVAAGWYHSLVLTEDGEVLGAGIGMSTAGGSFSGARHMGRGGPFQQVIRTGVHAISASGTHSLALTKSGTVLSWGGNDHGEIGNGTLEMQPVPVAVAFDQVTIAAGVHHCMCADEEYILQVWGHGVVPADDHEIDCPARFSVLEPTEIRCGEGAFFIAAGEAHCLIGGPEGEVMAYGQNIHGQVGNGSTADAGVPQEMMSGGTVEIVSQADRLAAAMKAPKEDYGPGKDPFGRDLYALKDAAPLVFGPPSVKYKGHRGNSGGVPDLMRRSAGVGMQQDLVLHLAKPAEFQLAHIRTHKSHGQLH